MASLFEQCSEAIAPLIVNTGIPPLREKRGHCSPTKTEVRYCEIAGHIYRVTTRFRQLDVRIFKGADLFQTKEKYRMLLPSDRIFIVSRTGCNGSNQRRFHIKVLLEPLPFTFSNLHLNIWFRENPWQYLLTHTVSCGARYRVELASFTAW